MSMPKQVRSHPLYGEIPLVRVPYKDRRGRESFYQVCDPNYKPPMPRGAVAGDVTRQDRCQMCHVPKYFYVDEEHVCVQCGHTFTFSAKEQKFWYEDLGFNFHSKAIRCPECRKSDRRSVVLQRAYTEALHSVSSKVDDVSALLALAEATVAYFRETGKGDLNRALRAVRRAGQLAPTRFEWMFWEGALQEVAGRPAKARDAYTRLIEFTRDLARYKKLAKVAGKLLAEGEE